MSVVEGPLPLRLKLVHGFGAVAFGVKDSGFSFFLLIFYNQVLGMDAGLVSLALLVALLVDAVVDPIIGNLSDRTYTRWGRRLPWLYLAPIPLAVVWVLLWSPPGGEAPSFYGLLAIAISVRLLLSACEVPSVSLVPEITTDYVERTTLFRYRFLSGWVGGLIMMLLAFGVFMPGAQGRLEQDGYLPFGIFGAVLMAVSVIGSAAGQHHLVAKLPDTKPPPFSFSAAFAEIFEAFSQRPFLIFAGGALAAYISQGMTFSLTLYLNLFVWQLDGTEEVIFALVLGLSVIVMFVIVGPMHQRFGKPRSAAIAAISSMRIGLTPYMLLLLGTWPQVGTPASTYLFFTFLLFGNTMGVVMMISATSMIAEVIEEFEEKTDRRAEGSFYSGNWLIQKCATGGGILLSGQIISIAQLSTDAQPGSVPASVVSTIIMTYGGATIMLALIAATFLGNFPISRTQHEARLERLAARRKGIPTRPVVPAHPIDAAARADPDAQSIAP
jgi:GPH family glycoside/pentoside/hexuronide:cation symporter